MLITNLYPEKNNTNHYFNFCKWKKKNCEEYSNLEQGFFHNFFFINWYLHSSTIQLNSIYNNVYITI